MLRKNKKQVFLIMASIVALAVTLSLPGWGEISLDINATKLPKMTVKVLGKTYGEWSAEWLLWAAKIPADQNPLFGEGEVDISIGQKGKVWFLAGSWVGPVERTGEVPANKALFFPIFNVWSYAEEGWTVDDCRAEAAFYVDLVDVVHCTVDGKASAMSYPTVRHQSPPFGYSSDVFGSSDLAVMDGYFVMVPPLPVGEHVIHFDGGISEFPWLQDVTYYITVVEDDDNDE